MGQLTNLLVQHGRRYQGNEFSLQASKYSCELFISNDSQIAVLEGVSCESASACMAVGNFFGQVGGQIITTRNFGSRRPLI